MLLSFKAENFLSFGEEMEFSMIQKSNERRFSHRVGDFDGKKVSRIRSIRGANGAGKSNLIKALKFLVDSMLEGKLDLKNYNDLSNKFQNNVTSTKLAISFIANFAEDYLIDYFIEFDAFKIIKEKIEIKELASEKNKVTFWKELDFDTEEYIIKRNNKSLVNKKEIKVSKTDLNEFKRNIDFKTLLFENENLQNEFLIVIFQIGINNLFKFEDLTKGQGENSLITSSLFSDLNKFNLFKQIVCSIDSGISDMEITEDSLERYFGSRDTDKKLEVEKKLKANFQSYYIEYDEDVDEYLYYFLNENGSAFVKFVKFYHKNEKGDKVEFNRGIESEGTQRILDLYPKLVSAFYTQSVWVIDEIEKSIHPNLLQQFIKKILEFPEMKGQIIYTTHDTITLDLNIFKQDEICFAHKNEKGNTEFYLLSDYEGIRNDLDIRKAYLNGRFDAVPFLEDLKIVNVEA